MLRIVPAYSEENIAQARNLFREYACMPGVAPCVEDFEREVSALPGSYAPPDGRLLLAFNEGADSAEGAIGCAALRKLHEQVCEMKRVYVRPAFRGHGAGRTMVEELIKEARSMGYKRLLLDTLPIMDKAHKLYRSLEFREIPSYQKNPVPGALFFELALI